MTACVRLGSAFALVSLIGGCAATLSWRAVPTVVEGPLVDIDSYAVRVYARPTMLHQPEYDTDKRDLLDRLNRINSDVRVLRDNVEHR